MDKAAQISVKPPSATHVALGLEEEPNWPDALTGKPVEPLPIERVTELPEEQRLAFLRGRLDGYGAGREMKLLVETQRSELLHALELILVAEEAEEAHKIARAAIDKVSRESL